MSVVIREGWLESQTRRAYEKRIAGVVSLIKTAKRAGIPVVVEAQLYSAIDPRVRKAMEEASAVYQGRKFSFIVGKASRRTSAKAGSDRA